MDILLLLFNLIVAIGLWFKTAWALIGLVFGIILFQWIPYTVLRQYFISGPEDVSTLNGLIVTEIGLIAVLFALMLVKK